MLMLSAESRLSSTTRIRFRDIASATGIMIGDKGERYGAIDMRSDGQAVGY